MEGISQELANEITMRIDAAFDKMIQNDFTFDSFKRDVDKILQSYVLHEK
jgi:hypothetical protein